MQVSEILGAGEIMLNCIDMDGQCAGYDLPLIAAVQAAVSVPVIASRYIPITQQALLRTLKCIITISQPQH